jgi:hypothetical protein
MSAYASLYAFSKMYMTVCTTCVQVGWVTRCQPTPPCTPSQRCTWLCVQAGWVTRCQPTPPCTPSQRCTASSTWSHRQGSYEYHIADDINGSLHEIFDLGFYSNNFFFNFHKIRGVIRNLFLSPVSCIIWPVHRLDDTGEKLSPVSTPPAITFCRCRWQRRCNSCNKIWWFITDVVDAGDKHLSWISRKILVKIRNGSNRLLRTWGIWGKLIPWSWKSCVRLPLRFRKFNKVYWIVENSKKLAYSLKSKK